MSDKGYVLAYRKAWDHEIFNDLLEAAIWNYLYQMAFWKPGERNMNGRVFYLKRGQIAITPRYLADQFRTSEKVVRGLIKRLEKGEMIVTQKSNKGTTVTICNYDNFQPYQETEDNQKENKGRAKGKAEGANKNESMNQLKNESMNHGSYDTDFEQFWSMAIRKKSKGNARRAYWKARKSVDKDTLHAAWQSFNEKWKEADTERLKFMKHPATWLNQECWMDDDDEPIDDKPKTGKARFNDYVARIRD